MGSQQGRVPFAAVSQGTRAHLLGGKYPAKNRDLCKGAETQIDPSAKGFDPSFSDALTPSKEWTTCETALTITPPYRRARLHVNLEGRSGYSRGAAAPLPSDPMGATKVRWEIAPGCEAIIGITMRGQVAAFCPIRRCRSLAFGPALSAQVMHCHDEL